MKKVLTVFLVTLISIGVTTASIAQTAGPSGQAGTLNAPTGAKHKGGGYNEKVMAAALAQILPTLNLTADQQSQIDKLNSDTKDQLKEIRKTTKGDKEARRTQMLSLNQSYHKQLFAILTPDQQKQFKQEFKDFMKKWHKDHQKPATTGTAPTAPTTPPSNP